MQVKDSEHRWTYSKPKVAGSMIERPSKWGEKVEFKYSRK